LSSFVSKDIDKLTNPKKHLSSAKSIISLALSYNSKNRLKNKYNYSISKYAHGKDYHSIFKEKMSYLINYLNDLYPNIKTISYVDTAPILDRAIANRAGLGWIGKNNNLINKKYGSFIFLGEILTNLDLEIDSKTKKFCGNCRKCIDNCPSGALNDAYNINPNKCISFLTQKKGIIPVKERKIIGNNLWGCDSCQEACPYNQNIPITKHDVFKVHLSNDLFEILNFSKNNFPKEWKEAALSWRGVRILRRNALIVIANKKMQTYKKEVKKLFSDPSSVIRAYAYWTYSQISNDYQIVLENKLRKEKSPDAKAEINNILKG
ncbi:MAG: tRNA epoxyqueuosine(34) reductase QueG, partial [Bacillota bacterium]